MDEVENAFDSSVTVLKIFNTKLNTCNGSHGVMVSTLDFESSDPSSNLGGTSQISFFSLFASLQFRGEYFVAKRAIDDRNSY